MDDAGQTGAFSTEVSIRTKPSVFDFCKVTSQSVYAPEYEAILALDGDANPFRAWISKPYGGGTKDQPQDVWWAVEFTKKPLTITGVRIVGDHREGIPFPKAIHIQIREGEVWKTVGAAENAAKSDATVHFAEPVNTNALRVYVPADDLPRSAQPDIDGIVRICELKFVKSDGVESGIDGECE